jgi:hypothetical protein
MVTEGHVIAHAAGPSSGISSNQNTGMGSHCSEGCSPVNHKLSYTVPGVEPPGIPVRSASPSEPVHNPAAVPAKMHRSHPPLHIGR